MAVNDVRQEILKPDSAVLSVPVKYDQNQASIIRENPNLVETQQAMVH
jgi:hypothetical protein